LKHRTEHVAQEAFDYFKAGTSELVSHRYEDAALSFRRSVSLIPTMSGHLNLGISLFALNDFKRAEDNFREGLVIAQSQSDALFSAFFYGNLALIASQNGRGEEAKQLVTEAIHLHKKLNQQKGEAFGLMNLGVMYSGENKFREAVYYYDLAISIYEKID